VSQFHRKRTSFVLVIVFGIVLFLLFLVENEQEAHDIVFVSQRDGTSELYAINSDGTGLTRLTFNAVEPNLFVQFLQRLEQRFPSIRLPTRLNCGECVDNIQPVWSPDGSHIAFLSDRDSSNIEIYLMDPDGSNIQRLTHHTVFPTTVWALAWALDGEQITFYRSDGDEWNLYAVDINDLNVEQITDLNPVETLSPTLSPDGTRIVFELPDENSEYHNRDIYVKDADDNNIRQLTFDPADDHSPAWSPNGEQIVFVSNRNSSLDLYIINSDSSGLRRLTFHGGTSPSWRR
jgi:TolB protein